MRQNLRMIAGVALIGACAALTGCGKYGLKGDRGLPPPPESVAYQNLNTQPARGEGRALRSAAEQERLKAEILARKPQRRR